MSPSGQTYDIIQYEGPSDIFVWKHGREDFNTKSQLIVHESQQAIFFKDGQALDLFGPGRHTLTTDSLPLLKRLLAIPSGGVTPFHCEVYFINRAVAMDMMWGTSSPIPMQDPQLSIILPLRANGQFSLSVQDSRKLLVKLVGTLSLFARDEVNRFFKGILTAHLKDILANTIQSRKLGILDINSHILEISNSVQQQLQPYFEAFGLNLNHFFINAVTVPEDDPGYVQVRQALAASKARSLQGYTYQDERTYDVAEKIATNEGAMKAVADAGMDTGAETGVGIGLGMASLYNRAMEPILTSQAYPSASPAAKNPATPAASPCSNCKGAVPLGASFCPHCGKQVGPGLQCPGCQTLIPVYSKFCLACGARVASEEEGK